MSERVLQSALIHLYANADRYPVYADAIFDGFALTETERSWLEELMTEQRDGLLLFQQLLHHKRRRSILHALPRARALAPEALDMLLDAYALLPTPEGAADPAETVRAFATFVGRRVCGVPDPSPAWQLVWFEATCAAVSSRAGEMALLPCTCDVRSAMNGQPLPDAPPHPYWFFVFQAASADVRVLSVGPGLARLLAELHRGHSPDEVLASLDTDTARAEAASKIGELVAMGALFRDAR